MNREEILTALKNDKQLLSEKFGVEEIALFGSYARNEQTDDSDIDVLVTLREPKLSHLVGVLEFLENAFKHKVDLTRKGPHLRKNFLTYIQPDLIYA